MSISLLPKEIATAVVLVGLLGTSFVVMKAYVDREAGKVKAELRETYGERLNELEDRVEHLESILNIIRVPFRKLRDLMVQQENSEALEYLDEIDDMLATQHKTTV